MKIARFRCIHCGRMFTRRIDEHDVHRYVKVERTDSKCGCTPPANTPDLPIMESVCDMCNE